MVCLRETHFVQFSANFQSFQLRNESTKENTKSLVIMGDDKEEMDGI